MADTNGKVKKNMTEQALDCFRRMGIGWFDDAGKWHSPEEPQPGNDGAKQSRTPNTDAVKRARGYISKIPPAVSGQGGHNQTFRVACELVLGFNLTIAEAMPLLREYSDRCQPPWSEKELVHKLRTADAKSGKRGYRITNIGDEKPTPKWVEQLIACQLAEEHEQARKPREFPLEVFPPKLQEYAVAVANTIGCPVDYAACSMISVAGMAIGNTRAIRIKRTWIETPHFYMAIVAPKSKGKTPSINNVLGPIDRRNNIFEKDFAEAKEAYEVQLAHYTMARRPKGGMSLPMAKPKEPGKQDIVTNNFTVESLVDMLSNNPRGMLLSVDELVGLVLGMNQYKGGKGNDRQFILTAESGTSWKSDRKSGHSYIQRIFLSILGGIQPSRLPQLEADVSANDGLLERILFSFPSPHPAPLWSDNDVADDLERFWLDVCDQLFSLQMMRTDFGVGPELMSFDFRGKAAWVDWYNANTTERNHPDTSEHQDAMYAKRVSHAARFAIVVHHLRSVCGEVDVNAGIDECSVACACELADYFKEHSSKVFEALMDTNIDNRCREAYKWIVNHGGKITARELIRGRVVGCKTNNDVRKLFQELKDRELGDYGTIRPEKGGKESIWFQSVVNDCHGQ